MSLESYRTHLGGLDLTEKEKDALIEGMLVIIENILNNDFNGSINNGACQ